MLVKIVTSFMKRLVWLSILVGFSCTVLADVQTGLIDQIKVEETQVRFTLKDFSGNVCLQDDESYTFDLSTPIKKYWSAMILAASHTGKKLSVRFDLCAVRGDKRVMYLYQDFD